MKDTTGPIIVKDTSQFIQENPTNELRWALIDSDVGLMLQYKVLQQKWEIVTVKGHVVVDCQTEWRDVPEVDETEKL